MQPFEHRRKILRRWTESNTHTNIFSVPNRDSNKYSNGDCNYNRNAYGHTYCYDQTYTNPKDRSHAKSAADARTATLALRRESE